MAEFLALQYRLGRVTAAQLQTLVGRVITDAEYILIVGGGSGVR